MRQGKWEANLGGISSFRNVFRASAGVLFGWGRTLHCKYFSEFWRRCFFASSFQCCYREAHIGLIVWLGIESKGVNHLQRLLLRNPMSSCILIHYTYLVYVFHFFLSGSFQYSVYPWFSNNLPWCGSFHHLLCQACGGFRQGNLWFQFWECCFVLFPWILPPLCFLHFFSFWDSYYLDAEYPRWILQFSYLSFLFSVYPFVLLSESSPRVPNVVLFKTFSWSVNFHFQELCVILSLILHCFFLHSDFGFLDTISSHLSDITCNFLKSKKHIENGSLRIRWKALWGWMGLVTWWNSLQGNDVGN